jgi:rRNA maturation protein Nop10
MNKTKYLKGECQHCGGHIEYPAELAGTTSQCPHCGQQTDLLLSAPPEEPSGTRRAMVWTISGVLILAFGLGASMVALKRAERYAREKQKPKAQVPAPVEVEQNGFIISPVELEKTQGSSLVYAVATVKNPTNRQRFGVRIEFDLLNAAGTKVGTAKDYQQVIETNAEWRCRALVVESKAVEACLTTIKEDQ